MPIALENFNKAKLQLHDTTSFFEGEDKDTWLADLKNSQWYGPFNSPDSDYFSFHSVTAKGFLKGGFDGVVLQLDFSGKEIYFLYDKPDGTNAGKPRHFFNK